MVKCLLKKGSESKRVSPTIPPLPNEGVLDQPTVWSKKRNAQMTMAKKA